MIDTIHSDSIERMRSAIRNCPTRSGKATDLANMLNALADDLRKQRSSGGITRKDVIAIVQREFGDEYSVSTIARALKQTPIRWRKQRRSSNGNGSRSTGVEAAKRERKLPNGSGPTDPPAH